MADQAKVDRFIAGAPRNRREILDGVRGGDADALCAMQMLLTSQPPSLDPTESLVAACGCLCKFAAVTAASAPAELQRARKLLMFGTNAVTNSCFCLDLDRPSRALKSLYKDEIVPLLEQLELAAQAGLLGAEDGGQTDLRVKLAMMVCNITPEWALHEFTRAPSVARAIVGLGADLARGYHPRELPAQHASVCHLHVATVVHRLVDVRELRDALWEDEDGVRGLCELQPLVGEPLAATLLLEGITQLCVDMRFVRLAGIGAPRMLAAVLSAPDKRAPEHKCLHLQAIGLTFNLLLEDGMAAGGGGRASRLLLRDGLLPLLLTKLEATAADAGSARAAAEQVEMAGQALIRLLGDENNLRKYAADEASVALLGRAAARKSVAQERLRKAHAIVSMLHGSAGLGDAAGARGMLHACHNAACAHHESADAKFALCARCKSVRYCSRACQKADWGSHKRMCCSEEQQAAHVHDMPSRASSSGRTKEQLTAGWMQAHLEDVYVGAARRRISLQKLVIWLDFTQPGPDGAVPHYELLDEDDGALEVLKRHGRDWWTAGQEANITMYFGKRAHALAAGIADTQLVHVCRFETSVFAGRYLLVKE